MRFEILSYGKNYKRDWQLTTCPTTQLFFHRYIKCGHLSHEPALGDVIPSLYSRQNIWRLYHSSVIVITARVMILWWGFTAASELTSDNAVAMIPLTFSLWPRHSNLMTSSQCFIKLLPRTKTRSRSCVAFLSVSKLWTVQYFDE